jgi:hypothetical protein
MGYKARKKTILFKVEVTSGTDSVPTGALNAIQTSEFSADPIEGSELSAEYDKPTLGADPETLVGKHFKFRFKVKMAGSGVAGDVPAFGPLLQCCGYAATVNAGVSVVYAVEDDGVKSGTLYYKEDGVLYKATYCKGKVTYTGAAKQYGHMEYEFIGLRVAESAAGAITPVYTAFQIPVPFRASTVSVSWNGTALGCHDFKVDGGQKMEMYEHSEAEKIEQEDRAAMADIKFEEPAIGTTNIYALCEAETKAALAIVWGTVGGNIFKIDAPLYQPLKPKKDKVMGISALALSGKLIADGTNPDHTITVM